MAISVHHLCGGRFRPHGGPLVYGFGAAHRHMVCHCLLLETDRALVLVDTGMGTHDLADPQGRLGRVFLGVARPMLDPAFTAVAQIRALGFDPADVRHVIVTHLDLDHIGGLADFPQARVHVMSTELRHATAQATREDRARYKPAQWAHGVDWVQHDAQGERWRGFLAVRDLDGLPPEVLMIPTTGHSAGHAAVAVDHGDGWLLHCGDAYFHHGEVDPARVVPKCPPALELFQRVVAYERSLRRANRDQLHALAREHRGDLKLVSAHDPVEFYGASGS